MLGQQPRDITRFRSSGGRPCPNALFHDGNVISAEPGDLAFYPVQRFIHKAVQGLTKGRIIRELGVPVGAFEQEREQLIIARGIQNRAGIKPKRFKDIGHNPGAAATKPADEYKRFVVWGRDAHAGT